MPDALISRITSRGPGVGSGKSLSSSLRSPRNTTPFMPASSRVVPGVVSPPFLVVQIITEPDGRERQSYVVGEEVQRVAPPGVAPHPDVVQDGLQVQADLEAHLPLTLIRVVAPVAFHAVGHGEEEIS